MAEEDDNMYVIIQIETDKDFSVYLQGQNIEDMLRRAMNLGQGTFGQYVGINEYYDLLDEISYMASVLSENDAFLNQKLDSVVVEVDDALWQANVRMGEIEMTFESQEKMLYEIIPTQFDTFNTQIGEVGTDLEDFRAYVSIQNDAFSTDLEATNTEVLQLQSKVSLLERVQDRNVMLILILATLLVLILLFESVQYLKRRRTLFDVSSPFSIDDDSISVEMQAAAPYLTENRNIGIEMGAPSHYFAQDAEGVVMEMSIPNVSESEYLGFDLSQSFHDVFEKKEG